MTPHLEQAGYRRWTGELRSPWWSVLAIVRVALGLIVRRWLFWILLGLGLMNFLYHFAFIYLKATIVVQNRDAARFMDSFKLTGTGQAYLNFMHLQAAIAALLLAFAGSLLIGADARRGGMIFYLSRSMDRRHYIIGKLLSIAAVVSLITTVPALILYVEYGMLSTSFDYFRENWRIAVGILGFGCVLAVVQSLMLFAVAVWVPRTVPLAMTWLGLFVLLTALGRALKEIADNRRWMLLALWEDMLRVGHWAFGSLPENRTPTAPETVIVLVGVCLVSLALIIYRVRAVEVVR
jgi:ABC-2 type transport system permease protein